MERRVWSSNTHWLNGGINSFIRISQIVNPKVIGDGINMLSPRKVTYKGQIVGNVEGCYFLNGDVCGKGGGWNVVHNACDVAKIMWLFLGCLSPHIMKCTLNDTLGGTSKRSGGRLVPANKMVTKSTSYF